MATIKRRWELLAISIIMFLLTLVSMSLTKQKSSLYLLFWIYIGYLSVKGNLELIFKWVKWAAIINAVGLVGILLFVDSDSSFLGTLGASSKNEMLLGVVIPLVVKLGILTYIIQIGKTSNVELLSVFDKNIIQGQYLQNLFKTSSSKTIALVVAVIFATLSAFYYLGNGFNPDEKTFEIGACESCDKSKNECTKSSFYNSLIVSRDNVLLIGKSDGGVEIKNMTQKGLRCTIIPSRNFTFDCKSLNIEGYRGGSIDSINFDGKKNMNIIAFAPWMDVYSTTCQIK